MMTHSAKFGLQSSRAATKPRGSNALGSGAMRSWMFRIDRHWRLTGCSVLFDHPRFHVVDVALRQNEKRFLPMLPRMSVVPGRHFPFTHHFETVLVNDNRGAFRQPEP